MNFPPKGKPALKSLVLVSLLKFLCTVVAKFIIFLMSLLVLLTETWRIESRLPFALEKVVARQELGRFGNLH